jgi:hypothetical protein
MTTVQISPEVQLQEMQAHVAMLQNRNLILAQAVAEARAMVAEREARIEELEAATVQPAEEEEAR